MFKIDNTTVGKEYEPFIIAEMSGNHNQSLERALRIVDAAAEAGAHAIKLQTYTADTMTLDIDEGEFFISDEKSLWKGQTLHSLYTKAHTPWEWHKPIMDRAKEKGIICFSSPFDETAVDFLETLDVPAYKIASFECIDIALIRKAASTGKPLIISTGMASIAEIAEAVEAARNAGCSEIALLKCTSTYPAPPEKTNLSTISHMRELFESEIGLSDHTMGIGVASAAVAFGATIIEKHFTLSRADGGVDSTFSLEPNELTALVVETKRAWQAVGTVKYGLPPEDANSIRKRRSLYFAENLEPGDILNDRNVRRVRPGYGLAPKYFEIVLGRKVKRTVRKGEPVSWDAIA